MIKNYFHIAWQNLRKNKSYLLINVLGLGLGLASAIIIFSVISYHLSFDNFHQDQDRIYRIVTEMHRDDIGYNKSVPAPLGKVLRDDYDFDEKIARIVTFPEPLITVNEGSEEKKFKEAEGLAIAEPEYFEIFNYPLLRGDKSTVLTKPNSAIMTERIAEKYFGSENPIGKTFVFDNRINLKVTGILKNFPSNSDQRTEIYASYPTLKSADEWLASDNSWGGIRDAMQCFIKLKPNITPAQVEAATQPYVKKFRPTSKNVHHYRMQPISEMHFDARYSGVMEKKNLWILSVIGIFLIITACVNFINLATAQALKRSREVGVRKVLGGRSSQIFRQFISETTTITAIAVVVAIAITYFLLPIVNGMFQTEISATIFTDWKFLSFALILSLIVAFFAGSYPGLVLARFRPVQALKGKISQQHVGGFNTRRSLVITQFAISQILIIGMVVIISQIQFTRTSHLGFRKDAVVMIPIGTDSTGLKQQALKNELLKIPGVENVSVCYAAPASEDIWGNSIKFDGSSEEVNFRTSIKSADDQYIPTFDLQLVAGRNVFPSDTVREFVVNESLVRKLQFKSPEAILGKTIAANGGQMSGPVVGVVKDFHDQSFHEDIMPLIIATNKDDYEHYAVRLNRKQVNAALTGIQQRWTQNHPDQLYEYQFLDESIAKFYTADEVMLKMIKSFAFIAIFISCLGLFGLMKFMAAQKTKEIGIRKVLGSSLAQITWIFGKEFAGLIIIGFLIAAPLAWYIMNNWLQDFKYRINIGVPIFVIAISGTFLIAFATVCYQAIRAANANPVKSLRSE